MEMLCSTVSKASLALGKKKPPLSAISPFFPPLSFLSPNKQKKEHQSLSNCDILDP
jgi:hypothetical protein